MRDQVIDHSSLAKAVDTRWDLFFEIKNWILCWISHHDKARHESLTMARCFLGALFDPYKICNAYEERFSRSATDLEEWNNCKKSDSGLVTALLKLQSLYQLQSRGSLETAEM